MKRVLGLLSTILLGATLVGCTIGGGEDQDDINSSLDLNVENPAELAGDVKIALPSSGGKRMILQKVIDKYQTERPNVNVEIEWKSNDNFYLNYQIDISGGLVYPDAAFIDHVYIQSLAGLDLIAPVSSVTDKIQDQYIDNLTKATEYNGLNYGFPMSANTLALLYNKDIVGDRKIPTTYEEFIEVGKDIYEQEKNKAEDDRNLVFSLSTGAAYKNFGAMIFNSWVKRLDGQLLSDDLKTSNLNSEPVKKALEMWKDLCDKGWANPALSNEAYFLLGKVAFIELGCWMIPTLFKDDAVANFGVAPFFSLTEGGENNSALGLYSLCITKQKDINRMKLAADLCKYISTNTETQVNYAKDALCLPVTKEGAKDEYFQQETWKVFVDALPLAARRPGSPEWPTVETEVGNMFMKVVLGRSTIDDAINTYNKKIQNKLDEFYEEI